MKSKQRRDLYLEASLGGIVKFGTDGVEGIRWFS